MSIVTLAEELGKCAALWPTLNPSNPAVISAYRESLMGFTDEELRAGFKRVRETHEGVSFPKPATLVALCGAARNRFTVGDARQAAPTHDRDGCEIKCGRCGTVALYHEATDDGSLGRLYPWHADECPLRRADNPRDGQSARIVWPQARNGGAYKAPGKVAALVRGHVAQVTTDTLAR